MLAVVRVAPAMYLVSEEDTQNLGHDQQCLQMLKSHRYSQLSDHNTLITSFLATVSQPNAIAVCGRYGRRRPDWGSGVGGQLINRGISQLLMRLALHECSSLFSKKQLFYIHYVQRTSWVFIIL